MNTEEMKLKKFEKIVKDIDELFGETYDMDGTPVSLFLGEEGNEYYKIILHSSFSNRYWRCNESIMTGQVSVDKSIEVSKYCTRSCTRRLRHNSRCNIKYPLIFWLLMAVAVDEEKYKSSLSVISDTAYILGYSEAMLEDWTKAVHAVLLGEDIEEVKYETNEAKLVFDRSRI